MKLLKHKNMKTVAFLPMRVIEERKPNYLKVFGYWYINQLNDINGCSETLTIDNLQEWVYFDRKKEISKI